MANVKNEKCGKEYDVIIVGAGPSGMTASIYAARREMKTLVICGEVGGEMKWYSKMDFCTGVTQATLPKITQMFEQHISSREYPICLCPNETVIMVRKTQKGFLVKTSLNRTYSCKSLIITVGKIQKMLDVPGEEVAIHGRGLSLCSSSDAPLYKEKSVVVVGGGSAAMDVCLQLTRLTDDIVLMTDLKELIGNKKQIQKIASHPNIVVLEDVRIQEILLDKRKRVKGVRYQEGSQEKIHFCKGIFKEIGHAPDTSFLQDFLTLNDKGEISVDRMCRTEYPGLFAAGNCTDQPHKQPIVSVGEGAIAALEARTYIQSL